MSGTWLTGPEFITRDEYDINMLKYPHSNHNQKGLSMRHKLTVAICLVAIAGLALYATRIHTEYKNQEAHAAAIAQSAQLKASEVANEKAATFQAGVKLDETQCARDQASYAALAPTVKVKTAAPDCETVIAQ